MIQEIANVVYQVAVIHGLLRVGKPLDAVGDQLADADLDTVEKWINLVTKIMRRENQSVDDILFDEYGPNYQGTVERETYVLYDTVLTIVNNLAYMKDQKESANWRHEL